MAKRKKKTSKKNAAPPAPELPVQELRLRPGRKANNLALHVTDQEGNTIRFDRMHPRVTLEIQLEAGYQVSIQPASDDELAEMQADLAK